MMKQPLSLLSLILILNGCESESYAPPPSRPVLPQPMSEVSQAPSIPIDRDSSESKALYSDVVNHPWYFKQPRVKRVTVGIAEDIRSFRTVHKKLNDLRIAKGQPVKTLDEDTEMLIKEVEKVQSMIDTLQLNFPENGYNVFNLPDQSYVTTPFPFKLYKRLLLDETLYGMPFTLDVRVFELTDPEKEIDAIYHWHLNLLENPEECFVRFPSDRGVVLIGRGDRNTRHYDPSHGIATKDRGVYLAFLQSEGKFLVLYADAPWKTFKEHREDLLKIMRLPKN